MEFKQRKTHAEDAELVGEVCSLSCSSLPKALRLHQSKDWNPILPNAHPGHQSHSLWHTGCVLSHTKLKFHGTPF